MFYGKLAGLHIKDDKAWGEISLKLWTVKKYKFWFAYVFILIVFIGPVWYSQADSP